MSTGEVEGMEEDGVEAKGSTGEGGLVRAWRREGEGAGFREAFEERLKDDEMTLMGCEGARGYALTEGQPAAHSFYLAPRILQPPLRRSKSSRDAPLSYCQEDFGRTMTCSTLSTPLWLLS